MSCYIHPVIVCLHIMLHTSTNWFRVAKFALQNTHMWDVDNWKEEKISIWQAYLEPGFCNSLSIFKPDQTFGYANNNTLIL